MSAEGDVEVATGQTITFASLKGVESAEPNNAACASLTAGAVSLEADDEVKVRRFSLIRTAILLGSIVGLVALSVGQASVGY